MRRNQFLAGVIGISMSFGGVVLNTPRLAHAAADNSMPVKVTNGVNGPVNTKDVGQSAGQMLHFNCEILTTTPDNGAYCRTLAVTPLPVNKNLVITAVDLMVKSPTGNLCSAATSMGFWAIGSATDKITNWLVAPNSGTLHLTYPTGNRDPNRGWRHRWIPALHGIVQPGLQPRSRSLRLLHLELT